MNEPITLDHLRRMPMGDVAALDPVTLVGLQDQANTALERAKSIKELLDGVLTRRYAAHIALLRTQIQADQAKERALTELADRLESIHTADNTVIAEALRHATTVNQEAA